MPKQETKDPKRKCRDRRMQKGIPKVRFERGKKEGRQEEKRESRRNRKKRENYGKKDILGNS